MESLYHQTNKQIQNIQVDLGRLERAPPTEVHIVENEIRHKLDSVISSCERLEILVNKEPPGRRPMAKMKVDQLKYDYQHLQAAMRSMQYKRHQKEEEEREREALMSRDFTTNDETSIMMDQSLKHNQGLYSANREVGDMINSGSNVLSNLREQRVTLKGAHKKILDVANTLGLSNTVLRLIERRTAQDKYILYGGMIFTCIIMFLVWKYFT